jgi:azurin
VHGLDGDWKSFRWRRIASGLNLALGVVTVGNEIYVLCRDQIMRLHDLNNDQEIDFYECFSKAFETSPAGHDFICDLWRDLSGRFYTASGNQGLVRISSDGTKAEILGTGLRNPDGMAITPDGWMTAGNSEGEWVPASMVCAVNLDASNNSPAFFGHRGPRDGQVPDLPLVYLPRGWDNSSGGQAYVSSDRFGPIQGKMIHLSFGAGRPFLLLRDQVADQIQGTIIPLVGEFRSGAHRAKFNPHDGQLYVSGMTGWGNYSTDDGCFQRLRYTGGRAQMPVATHPYANGVLIEFALPADRDTVSAVGNHFAQSWNYRYSGGYGSAEYSSRHVGVRGHDVWPIQSAHVLPDGRRVFLEMPDLQPVNQLHLCVESNSGELHDLMMTVHRLDEPFREITGLQVVEKLVQPHPILADMSQTLRKKRNPFEKAIEHARGIDLETSGNLSFAQRELRAKPGEAIRLTLVNPDVVPHNWVLIKPGTLSAIGQETNQMIGDPEAAGRQYVPVSDDVLFYTDIVEPNGRFTIHFRAPATPGRYPYLCTFPGHWMVMNGELIVQ